MLVEVQFRPWGSDHSVGPWHRVRFAADAPVAIMLARCGDVFVDPRTGRTYRKAVAA